MSDSTLNRVKGELGKKSVSSKEYLDTRPVASQMPRV
jgi:hypothetical protein